MVLITCGPPRIGFQLAAQPQDEIVRGAIFLIVDAAEDTMNRPGFVGGSNS
jgi:hypothetical protein